MPLNPTRIIHRLATHWLPLAALLALSPSLANGQAEESRPNFLFIMVDDLNDWIGVNGAGGHPQALTPSIDRLAENGLYFSNAHCAVAVCGPSRFSIMTGMRPTTTGYTLNSDAESGRGFENWPTLPSLLKADGYETLAAGKIYHLGTKCSVSDVDDWNLKKPRFVLQENWLERGHGYGGRSTFFHPFPLGGSPIVERLGYTNGYSLCGAPLDEDDVSESEMPDTQIADWAIERLQETRESPFFLALGFARPHVPYTAPRRYFDLYDADSLVLPDLPSDEMDDIPQAGKEMALGFLPGGDHRAVLDMGPDYWRDLVHSYLACISFVDAQIGRVLSALEASPYRGNTVVVLLSDHGQELGEKTSWRKMSLWEESTRVPLIIALPNQSKGDVCEEAVSLIDIAPTVLQLANVSSNEKREGESLYPFFDKPKATRDTPAIMSWDRDNFAVRDERWRYIRYADGTEELYDHASDPNEHTNLAQNPKWENEKQQLLQWIPQAAQSR